MSSTSGGFHGKSSLDPLQEELRMFVDDNVGDDPVFKSSLRIVDDFAPIDYRRHKDRFNIFCRDTKNAGKSFSIRHAFMPLNKRKLKQICDSGVGVGGYYGDLLGRNGQGVHCHTKLDSLHVATYRKTLYDVLLVKVAVVGQPKLVDLHNRTSLDEMYNTRMVNQNTLKVRDGLDDEMTGRRNAHYADMMYVYELDEDYNAVQYPACILPMAHFTFVLDIPAGLKQKQKDHFRYYPQLSQHLVLYENVRVETPLLSNPRMVFQRAKFSSFYERNERSFGLCDLVFHQAALWTVVFNSLQQLMSCKKMDHLVRDGDYCLFADEIYGNDAVEMQDRAMYFNHYIWQMPEAAEKAQMAQWQEMYMKLVDNKAVLVSHTDEALVVAAPSSEMTNIFGLPWLTNMLHVLVLTHTPVRSLCLQGAFMPDLPLPPVRLSRKQGTMSHKEFKDAMHASLERKKVIQAEKAKNKQIRDEDTRLQDDIMRRQREMQRTDQDKEDMQRERVAFSPPGDDIELPTASNEVEVLGGDNDSDSDCMVVDDVAEYERRRPGPPKKRQDHRSQDEQSEFLRRRCFATHKEEEDIDVVRCFATHKEEEGIDVVAVTSSSETIGESLLGGRKQMEPSIIVEQDMTVHVIPLSIGKANKSPAPDGRDDVQFHRRKSHQDHARRKRVEEEEKEKRDDENPMFKTWELGAAIEEMRKRKLYGTDSGMNKENCGQRSNEQNDAMEVDPPSDVDLNKKDMVVDAFLAKMRARRAEQEREDMRRKAEKDIDVVMVNSSAEDLASMEWGQNAMLEETRTRNLIDSYSEMDRRREEDEAMELSPAPDGRDDVQFHRRKSHQDHARKRVEEEEKEKRDDEVVVNSSAVGLARMEWGQNAMLEETRTRNRMDCYSGMDKRNEGEEAMELVVDSPVKDPADSEERGLQALLEEMRKRILIGSDRGMEKENGGGKRENEAMHVVIDSPVKDPADSEERGLQALLEEMRKRNFIGSDGGMEKENGGGRRENEATQVVVVDPPRERFTSKEGTLGSLLEEMRNRNLIGTDTGKEAGGRRKEFEVVNATVSPDNGRISREYSRRNRDEHRESHRGRDRSCSSDGSRSRRRSERKKKKKKNKRRKKKEGRSKSRGSGSDREGRRRERERSISPDSSYGRRRRDRREEKRYRSDSSEEKGEKRRKERERERERSRSTTMSRSDDSYTERRRRRRDAWRRRNRSATPRSEEERERRRREMRRRSPTLSDSSSEKRRRNREGMEKRRNPTREEKRKEMTSRDRTVSLSSDCSADLTRRRKERKEREREETLRRERSWERNSSDSSYEKRRRYKQREQERMKWMKEEDERIEEERRRRERERERERRHRSDDMELSDGEEQAKILASEVERPISSSVADADEVLILQPNVPTSQPLRINLAPARQLKQSAAFQQEPEQSLLQVQNQQQSAGRVDPYTINFNNPLNSVPIQVFLASSSEEDVVEDEPYHMPFDPEAVREPTKEEVDLESVSFERHGNELGAKFSQETKMVPELPKAAFVVIFDERVFKNSRMTLDLWKRLLAKGKECYFKDATRVFFLFHTSCSPFIEGSAMPAAYCAAVDSTNSFLCPVMEIHSCDQVDLPPKQDRVNCLARVLAHNGNRKNLVLCTVDSPSVSLPFPRILQSTLGIVIKEPFDLLETVFPSP